MSLLGVPEPVKSWPSSFVPTLSKLLTHGHYQLLLSQEPPGQPQSFIGGFRIMLFPIGAHPISLTD